MLARFGVFEVNEVVLVRRVVSIGSDVVSRLDWRRFGSSLEIVDNDVLFDIGGRMTCEAPLRYERWKSNFVGEGDRAAIAANPPGLAMPFTDEVDEDGFSSFDAPACMNLSPLPFGWGETCEVRSVSAMYERVLVALG